jgi:hypothetical protein
LTPFDSWTLIHFLGWFLVVFIYQASKWQRGALQTATSPYTRSEEIIGALFFSFFFGVSWEIAELFLPIHEIWVNKCVTDPLANMSGAVSAVVVWWKVRR